MLPLEDNFNDIAGKALRGLGLNAAEAAQRAGTTREKIEAFLKGEWDAEIGQALAPLLGISASALAVSAEKGWRPEPVEVPGLAQFSTPWEDMVVNSFLAWDAETREAVAFDTGADCSEMLEKLAAEQLTLKAILLTHTHTDHVFELDRLHSRTSAPAYVGEREPLDGAESFAEGRTFAIGKLRIETLLTWGHSPGGITYVIHGLPRPVAVVGDSIFAGSMGGGGISYKDALENNRSKILTLPKETVLCPGHGPLTTVSEELAHNPFFAH